MKAQRSYDPQEQDVHQRFVPAIVLIAVGAIFFLSNLHILSWHDLSAYWPVALIAVGLYKTVDSDDSSHRTAGGVLIVIGGLLLANNLGYLYFTWREMWPLLLIGLGVLMLFDRLGWSWPTRFSWNEAATSSANVLFETAVFSGGKRRLVVSDFHGGKVDAVFGGFEIDLRNCDIAGDSAVLELNAVFGGVELRVPETWAVVCKGAGVFGGYSDETRHPNPAQLPNPKQLICKGGAVFGGVVIKN
ncbi:MAG: LiaI-LiaF-like domain-containing protein [Bryobacteraceae bacterium]